MEMDVSRIMFELRRVGCQLYVGEDGAVHGKMLPGMRMPMEARPLVDALRLGNAEAVRIMALEKTVVVDEDDFDMPDWKWKINQHLIELAGPVTVNQNTGEATIIYREVARDG